MTEHFPSGGEAFPDDLHLQAQQPEPAYLDDRHLAFLSDPDMLSVPLDRGFQDIQRNGEVDPERVPRRLRMVPIVDRTGGYTPTEYVVRPITSLEAMQQVGTSILDTNFDDGIRLHCASLLAQDRKSAAADMLLNGVRDDILRMQSRTILGEYASMEVTVDQFNADYHDRTEDDVLRDWIKIYEPYLISSYKSSAEQEKEFLQKKAYFQREVWGDLPFPERLTAGVVHKVLWKNCLTIEGAGIVEKYINHQRGRHPELEDLWGGYVHGLVKRSAQYGDIDALSKLYSLIEGQDVDIFFEAMHGYRADNLKFAMQFISKPERLLGLAQECASERGYDRFETTSDEHAHSGMAALDDIEIHRFILRKALDSRAVIHISPELEAQIDRKLEQLDLDEWLLVKAYQSSQGMNTEHKSRIAGVYEERRRQRLQYRTSM